MVLASNLHRNLHRNLHDAFLRRFKAVLYVPPLCAQERLRLWPEGFSPRPHVKADLERLVREHDLSGGAIINVIRKVRLPAIARGRQASGEDEEKRGATLISESDIEEAFRSGRSKNG